MTDDLRNLLEEQPKTRNTISISAIVSLITGIGTYVWFFAMIGKHAILTLAFTPIIAIITIIFGHKAKRQIRKSSGSVKGKKLANIGLFLGYLCIAIGVITLIIIAIIGGSLISILQSLFA